MCSPILLVDEHFYEAIITVHAIIYLLVLPSNACRTSWLSLFCGFIRVIHQTVPHNHQWYPAGKWTIDRVLSLVVSRLTVLIRDDCNCLLGHQCSHAADCEHMLAISIFLSIGPMIPRPPKSTDAHLPPYKSLASTWVLSQANSRLTLFTHLVPIEGRESENRQRVDLEA